MISISQSTANPILAGSDGSGRGLENAKQRKAFADLDQDLQSGDIGSAKKAFAVLTKNVPAAVLNSPNTALGQLNQALQTGNTSAASTALDSFASNVHDHRAPTSPIAPPVSLPVTTSSTGGTAGSVLSAVA